MRVDVSDLGVDLLTFSGHKIYGPKGVGVLVVRGGPKVKLSPITTGGDQEGGLRAGTVPTPLVVGLGEACEIVEHEWGQDASRMSRLGNRLLEAFEAECPQFNLFGHPTCRVPGSLSLGVPGLLAEALIAAIADRVAVSTGSACASARAEPSRSLYGEAARRNGGERAAVAAERGSRASAGRDSRILAGFGVCSCVRAPDEDTGGSRKAKKQHAEL